MEGIYNWLRVILAYRILSVIILELVPGEKNKKIISVFSGLVMILMLIEPIGALAEIDGRFELGVTKHLLENQFFENDLIEADNMKKQAILQEYTQVIKDKINEFVEEEGLVMDDVEVIYDMEGFPTGDNMLENPVISISRIYVTVSKKYEMGEAVKRAYDKAYGDTASIEEINIKKAIQNVYKIDSDNIIYEER